MALFPGFRGLTGKAVAPRMESKIVYDSSGRVIEDNTALYFGGSSSSRPQGGEWDINRALNEAYLRDPYAFKAIDTIAEKSSSLEFKLKDGEDVVEDHPLYNVLNHGKANPLETGRQFRKRLSTQIMLNPTRGAFVNVVKSNGGDVVGLALLPPDRTFPIPNESDPSKLIAGFLVKPKDGKDKPVILPVDAVRWVRNPHPLDPFSAVSPLTPAGTSILLSYFARLFNLAFMRNDGRPGGILGVEADMEDDDMDRIEAKFGRGPMESGKLTVLGGKVTYTDTGQAPRDMQYPELSGNAAKEIAIAFGVPESVMGAAAGTTFANADAEAYSFWINTMVPHNDIIVSSFAEDSDPNLIGFLDTSGVEELQEPIRKKRAEQRDEVENGLRSLKQYGDAWGIDVPDIPETRAFYIIGGKQAIPGDEKDRDFFAQQQAAAQGPQQQQFADSAGDPNAQADAGGSGGFSGTDPGTAATEAGNAPTGPSSGGGQFAARTRTVAPSTPAVAPIAAPNAPAARSGTSVATDGKQLEGKAEADPQSAESAAPDELFTKTETALIGVSDVVVNRQASVVVARLKSPRYRKGTKHWVADESKPVDSRMGMKTLDAEAVVQASKWADELVESLTPIVTEACQSAAEGIITDLGLSDDHETKARHRRVTPKQAQVIAQVAAEALGLARGGMVKHSESLAARIKEADDAGKDLDAIVADVQAYAEQFRIGWSRVLMERVGQVAIEQTRLRTADLSKRQRDIRRTWVARKDDKTRPTHKAANGQVKKLGDPFTVGESKLRFPGDPLGKPDQTFGCRCRLSYTAKSTGRFIPVPKGQTTSNPSRKGLELVWSVA